MANKGFSAPVNFWGDLPGLTAKSSQDGRTSSVAECPNSYGDTVAHDVYGDVIAPSVEYAVTGEIKKEDVLIALGAVFKHGEKHIMPTTVAVNTQAGTPPTVTISGVEVEAGAKSLRTYPVNIDLTPRSKAQDVVGAFTASDKFTQINTTIAVDPHVQTVAGAPVSSDAGHGRIEVQATMTDGDGSGSITAAKDGGFTVTTAPSESDGDAAYITRAATATKYLIGTEAA